MKLTIGKEQVGGLCFLLFSLVYGYLTLSIPVLPQFADGFTARSMPGALAVLGTIVSLLLMLRKSAATVRETLNWRLGLAFVLLMSAYGSSLRPAGFLLSTLVFLAAGFLLLGERRWLPITLVAAGITGGFWLLMNYVLGVYVAPWPGGL